MTSEFPCQAPCEKVIEIGEQIASLSTQVTTLNDDMYNHGKNGVKTRLSTFEVRFDGFVDLYNERENSRDRAWNRFRWVATLIIAFGMLVLAALQATKQIHQGFIRPPRIGVAIPSQDPYTATTRLPQNAAE